MGSLESRRVVPTMAERLETANERLAAERAALVKKVQALEALQPNADEGRRCVMRLTPCVMKYLHA
jgi:hypothetical protein